MIIRIRDERIVKYNVDFVFKDYKYSKGCVSIDLYDLNDMKAEIIAEWTEDFARKHLMQVLKEGTGIGGGWAIPMVTIADSKYCKAIKVFTYKIDSRLYKNLRRIYEKR